METTRQYLCTIAYFAYHPASRVVTTCTYIKNILNQRARSG